MLENKIVRYYIMGSIAIILSLLFLMFVKADSATWDKSSLYFQVSCTSSCESIQAEVCNGGEDMDTGSVYQVYYAATENPKNGTQVSSGSIPALKTNECTLLSYIPISGGNYMFRALQAIGHPGKGELWSEQCTIDECTQLTITPTATPAQCEQVIIVDGCEYTLTD